MWLLDVVDTQTCLHKMTAAFEEAELFFGHGTDNAWDEACWLLETLARHSGLPALQLDTPLPAELLAKVEQLADARISSRKPMAYLLNEAWFCGLPFYVDNRFDTLLTKAPRRILDLCAGGGCIGIACALAFPQAEVVLADLSLDALAVARLNVDKHGVGQRVRLVESDLFTKVTGLFDLVVSNPPYVGVEEYEELPAEYLREPRLGLLTGNEGLEIPLRILQRAADFMTDDGLLLLETGATWSLLDAARPDLPFLWLDFAYGGEGICALTAKALRAQSR
jgi:ribosomal protein L3 glutamine methyltransferase